MAHERIHIGRVPVDAVTQEQALARIVELARSTGGTVFTPNVDHVMRVEEDAAFREAYSQVTLSLVDGMPVLWASRWLGTPLPEKVSGSDLIAPLFSVVEREGLGLYVVGGRVGASDAVRQRCAKEWPRLKLMGCSAPTRVIEQSPEEALSEVLRDLERLAPNVVVVALSSPAQERFAVRAAKQVPGAVFVCSGSAIDLLAGQIERAPAWMRNSGLEWAYRLSKEPRRLAHRYLVRDPPFFALVAKQAMRSRKR